MGHPVAQSRSPMLHGYWLKVLQVEGAYERADVPPEEFPGFFRDLPRHGFVGGNIINTVWFENGILVGGNTDYLGYLAHADDRAPGWDAAGGRAVVLGAGGAARGVVYGLRERGLDIALINRTRPRAEELAKHFAPHVRVHDFTELPSLMRDAVLLTNTSALGALGQPALDIDLTPLRETAVVYDINYVPLETELIKAAAARGLRTVDGLGMLLHQAVPAFAKWFGAVPKVTAELRALLEADIRAKTGSG
jgi:shikimate dehydrogenase